MKLVKSGKKAKKAKAKAKKTPSKVNLSQKVEEVTPSFTVITDPSAIAQFKSIFGSLGFGSFRLPKGAKWVDLYTKPVPTNWGPNRLHRMLSEDYQIDPKNRAFLFFNKAQDQLRLYVRDDDGDQITVKMLERGGFMFPTADSAQDFIKVPAKKLATLFRSS